MELHQIRYFLAVAREQHFSRAAASCNVTQPALTRAIQKLEEEMGGPLFDRRPGRSIELTELGRTLLPRFETAMKEMAEARTDAKSLLQARKRKLRLGLTCTVGPSRLVKLLKLLYMRIPNLELSLREAKGSQIAEMLARDEIDAAIVGLPTYFPDFEAVLLYREYYVVALPAGHPLLAGNEVELAQLEGANYLQRLHCEFDDHFEAQHGEWPIQLNVTFESEREDWIQSLLAAGFGCAIVPEYLAMQPGIETRRLVGPETYRDVSVVTVRGRTDTAPIAELITTARETQWLDSKVKP